MKKYRLKEEVKKYLSFVGELTAKQWKEKGVELEALEEVKEVLTYKDVAMRLFDGKQFGSTNDFGKVTGCIIIGKDFSQPNNALTSYQLECLMASNMLTNVANYLNGGHEFKYKEHVFTFFEDEDGSIFVVPRPFWRDGKTCFKTEELAQQAIEILGEEKIRMALTKNF